MSQALKTFSEPQKQPLSMIFNQGWIPFGWPPVVPISTPVTFFPPSFSTTDSFHHADIIGLWVHHHANLGQKNPRWFFVSKENHPKNGLFAGDLVILNRNKNVNICQSGSTQGTRDGNNKRMLENTQRNTEGYTLKKKKTTVKT